MLFSIGKRLHDTLDWAYPNLKVEKYDGDVFTCAHCDRLVTKDNLGNCYHMSPLIK